MPSVGKKRIQEPINCKRQQITELTSFVNCFRHGLKQIRASLFQQRDLQVPDVGPKLGSSEVNKDVIPSEESFAEEFRI
jgi:hypothetical protein